MLAGIGCELAQQLARGKDAAGQGGGYSQDVRTVAHDHILPDFVAGQSDQWFRNASGFEDVETFRGQVPDTRDEPVAERGCDGETWSVNPPVSAYCSRMRRPARLISSPSILKITTDWREGKTKDVLGG